MALFSLHSDTGINGTDYLAALTHVAGEAAKEGLPLRHDPDLNNALGLLWDIPSDQTPGVPAGRRLAWARDPGLSGMRKALGMNSPPAAERYSALERVVVQILEGCASGESRANPAWASAAARLCRVLQISAAQGALCDLRLAAVRAEIKERGSTVWRDVATDAAAALAALPPAEAPCLWEKLADPRVSQDFWSVAARIERRDATPFLMDALKAIKDDDGRAAVIGALRRMADSRALPLLQEAAHWNGAVLQPIAEDAVKEILKRSRDDSAQLLRAGAADLSEELLRASKPGASQTAPDELLRASGKDTPATG